MELFKEYLKDHKKLISAGIVSTAAAAFLFYLYDLPAGPLLYTGLLIGVILLFFFILPNFAAYARRTAELRRLRRNLPDSLDFFPLPGPLPEREAELLAAAFCEKAQGLEAASAHRYEEMLDYYTLWVHQIKTPLSAMRLILRSPGWDENSAEAMIQELFKVERYVEMVLGYLRLESMNSDLCLERCSLREIVTQAVRKFAPQFIYQKLSLDFQEFDNQVLTDKKWLGFVVEQLLSNALKYTREGGVSIFVEAGDVLVIRDTGSGISPEDLPRIFERGFTGRNGRTGQENLAETSSTGLGLYLARQILDRLQNRIELSSAPGQGTEARLYLHREELAGD